MDANQAEGIERIDESEFHRIELEVENQAEGRPLVTKAFFGRWLITDFAPESQNVGAGAQWSIAETEKGNIAVYFESDDLKRLDVYESLGQADGHVPDDVLAAAAAGLGIEWVVDLEI